MTNTTKALSKQFFGAKYQSAGKSLLAAVILFIATDAAEFQMETAPFILYLTSTFFTGGVMWQLLTGKRHIEAMQGMFMLPFDNRSFVFSYVMVLGAHTLITKTLPIWALFFAAASWHPWEIAIAVFCGCMACAVTAAGYRMCRKGLIVLPVLWAAGILAVTLLVRQDAAVLTAGAVSLSAAALYLAFADAYDFYSAAASKRAVQHTGHSGSVFVYLTRYLLANKSYLINTVGLCAIACFLPLLFGEFRGTESVSHRPCDPLPEHSDLYAAVLRPGFGAGHPCSSRTGRPVLQEILPVYLYCQRSCRGHLSVQLADCSWGDRTCPCGDGSSVCLTKRHPVGDVGMETPDPRLENRKRFVAPPPQISRPAGNAADGGPCRHLPAGSWDMVCRVADGVRHFTLLGKEGMKMKNTGCCPKCHSRNIVRAPDNPNRHASGNNIYTTTMTLFGKIPVIRYVCCDCGYVENWVEKRHELDEIKKAFG